MIRFRKNGSTDCARISRTYSQDPQQHDAAIQNNAFRLKVGWIFSQAFEMGSLFYRQINYSQTFREFLPVTPNLRPSVIDRVLCLHKNHLLINIIHPLKRYSTYPSGKKMLKNYNFNYYLRLFTTFAILFCFYNFSGLTLQADARQASLTSNFWIIYKYTNLECQLIHTK